MPSCKVCGKLYKSEGKCLKKHEESCFIGTPISNSKRNCSNKTNTNINIDNDVNISLKNTSLFNKKVLAYFKSYSLDFNVALININSILNKFNDISFILDKRCLQLLVINETRLTADHDDSIFQHVSYTMHRRDRGLGSRGGGVIVYVKKGLNHFRNELDSEVEMISLILEPCSGVKISFIACYRPPHYENETLFFSTLEKKLIENDSSSSETIIVGDLNFDISTDTPERGLNKLDEFINSNGLFNTIKKGTRYNREKDRASLLDVILCYKPESYTRSDVFPCPFSDHSLIISSFKFKKPVNHTEYKLIRCLNVVTLDAIKYALSLILLVFTFIGIHAVDQQWSLIKSIIVSVVNYKAPEKNIRLKQVSASPWVDKELICMAKQRSRLYNCALKTKDPTDWKVYTLFRNKYTSIFGKKKIAYFNNFINTTSSTTKIFWKKLSPFINPNKKCSLSPSLILKNNSHNTILDLGNTFVNYFASVTNKFTFLGHEICNQYIDKLFSTTSLKILSSDEKFSINQFETESVITELKNIEEFSSPGAIDISPKVLKHCAKEIGPSLTNLFNLCIAKNEIPDEWKIAYITPVYKGSGSKSELNNYRPISVISPIAKIFESLLARQIMAHLENTGLLHGSQFGFRANRSCELALNTMIDEWRRSLDISKSLVSVFLDLSKAFDTVDHTLLIRKLQFYNFSIDTIKLISNYLSNRTIRVNIDGTLSKSEKMSVGIPQGTVLGPVLFIVYINDMCHLPLSAILILFADDTSAYLSGFNLTEILEKLAMDMEIIKEWLNHNRLVLNLSKTHAIHFPTKLEKLSTNLPNLSELSIKCGVEKIGFVKETKILGVILDNELKFTTHVDAVCKKVNSKSFLLSKTIHLFSKHFRPTLFKLLIQSHFDYCSSLILHIAKMDRNRLERCFNKSIYRLLRINIFELHHEVQYPILKEYNILPYTYRQLFHFTSFLYKIVNNKSSDLFKNIDNYNKTRAGNLNVDRSSRTPYTVPSFKTDFMKYSFSRTSINFLNNFLTKFIEEREHNKINKIPFLSLKVFFHKNVGKLSRNLISFIT